MALLLPVGFGFAREIADVIASAYLSATSGVVETSS
jgi:hypothetical protein